MAPPDEPSPPPKKKPRPKPSTPLTSRDITVVLLSQPEYRERVVDEIVLESEGQYRLRRSIQLGPVRELLEDAGFVVADGEQPVVLPLCLLPKSALLDFNVNGPDDNEAFLVRRPVTADRQVYFLRALATAHRVETSDEVADLLFGLCAFTPGKLYAAREEVPQDDVKVHLRNIAFTLNLVYERDFPVELLSRWKQLCDESTARLCDHMDVQPDSDSSADVPLLALIEHPAPTLSDAEMEAALVAFAAWQDALFAAGAYDVLQWLWTFGRRYTALIETRVDPDRMALLKMSERRELDVTWRLTNTRPLPSFRASGRFELQLDEGQSHHLRIKSEDENIGLLGSPRIVGETGDPVGSAFIDGTAPSVDGYALYTSDPDREGHVQITMPLRLSGDVRRSLALTYGLAGAAALVAIGWWDSLDNAAISLLTLPATFSATVLLVRERTSLSAKILRWYKNTLVLAIGVLWLFSLLRVIDLWPPGAADEPASAVPPSPAATAPSAPSTSPVTSPPTATLPPSPKPKPAPAPGTSPPAPTSTPKT